MKLKNNLSILVTIFCLFSISCSTTPKRNTSTKKAPSKEIMLDFSSGPQTIIYKTKKDYSKLVPVTLSEDKSKIVSYPHPKDVFYKGGLAYPTDLKDGYLLDNRGININVAFLNMTYYNYSKLENAPLLDRLYSMILDKDPLIELYNCGNRQTFKNEISDLNILIKNKGLKACKCLTKN